MEREDCFGYVNSKGEKTCHGLQRLYCAEGNCEFYKSIRDINVATIEVEIHRYNRFGANRVRNIYSDKAF